MKSLKSEFAKCIRLINDVIIYPSLYLINNDLFRASLNRCSLFINQVVAKATTQTKRKVKEEITK